MLPQRSRRRLAAKVRHSGPYIGAADKGVPSTASAVAISCAAIGKRLSWSRRGGYRHKGNGQPKASVSSASSHAHAAAGTSRADCRQQAAEAGLVTEG